VLFTGNDSSGYPGLWATNGTPAGTSELNVVGGYKYGLDPSNFTVLGSEVIFDGLDENQRPTLWITNGTTAGTSEITVPTPSLV
jgi:ELWxxDGT repeat protein